MEKWGIIIIFIFSNQKSEVRINIKRRKKEEVISVSKIIMLKAQFLSRDKTLLV